MKYAKYTKELLAHFEKAQNPIIYYDNDADGLCSFLLLRRYLGRGKGVAIRSYPELHHSYTQSAEKMNADYVFILDKPVISSGFIDRVALLGLPVVWIDHHDTQQEFSYEQLYVYNPVKDGIECRATSEFMFDILGKKKDHWIALAGCISDSFVPDFIEEVKKEYPDLFTKGKKEAFDILYGTEFGRIVRALNYGLKDSAGAVGKLQNFLIGCNGPNNVLSDSEDNSRLREKAQELFNKQEKLVEEAGKDSDGKLIFFTYAGETSMSSDVANELSYRYPGKYICVGYKNGGLTNFSMRGKGVKKVLDRVIKKMEHVSGGGHEDAVGARVMSIDVEEFKKNILEEIGEI